LLGNPKPNNLNINMTNNLANNLTVIVDYFGRSNEIRYRKVMSSAYWMRKVSPGGEDNFVRIISPAEDAYVTTTAG